MTLLKRMAKRPRKRGKQSDGAILSRERRVTYAPAHAGAAIRAA